MKKVKGFTLIELMIVVAIIGILAAIAIPKFADLVRKANEAATKGNLGALRSAVSIYYGDMEGAFPAVTASGDSSTGGSLGNILTVNNGMFIKSMPSSYVPPYHTASATVYSLNTASAENPATNAGAWGYNNNATPATTDKGFGDVWVNCTHTDTKTSVWGTY